MSREDVKYILGFEFCEKYIFDRATPLSLLSKLNKCLDKCQDKIRNTNFTGVLHACKKGAKTKIPSPSLRHKDSGIFTNYIYFVALTIYVLYNNTTKKAYFS